MRLMNLSLLNNVKYVITLAIDKALSCLLMSPQALEAMMPSNRGHDQPRPNPASLVPVPLGFFADVTKEKLPAMPYGSFLEKSKSDRCTTVCVVCLNRIELSHEIREPCNCSHVFHMECLDLWVDQGHGTCPLCRSELLPSTLNHADDDRCGREGVDPFRRERMIYLFGEDCLFGGDDHQN